MGQLFGTEAGHQSHPRILWSLTVAKQSIQQEEVKHRAS